MIENYEGITCSIAFYWRSSLPFARRQTRAMTSRHYWSPPAAIRKSRIHQADQTGHPAKLLRLVDPSHKATHVRIGMVAVGNCQASDDQFGICRHQRVMAMAVVEYNGQTLVRWRPTSPPHGRGHATCSPHHSWAPHAIPWPLPFVLLTTNTQIEASQTNNFLLLTVTRP